MKWNWFGLSGGAPTAADVPPTLAVTTHTPITSQEVVVIGKEMAYRRYWRCGCGAMLRIRARVDRLDGSSNFVPYPAGHPYAGHSKVRSDELTWDGLAEERGWKVNPVECPACQRNLSRAQYKVAKAAAAR